MSDSSHRVTHVYGCCRPPGGCAVYQKRAEINQRPHQIHNYWPWRKCSRACLWVVHVFLAVLPCLCWYTLEQWGWLAGTIAVLD